MMIEFRAQEMAPNRARRRLSTSPSGPAEMPRAGTAPTSTSPRKPGFTFEHFACAKGPIAHENVLHLPDDRPFQAKCVSCIGRAGFRLSTCPSRMLSPPVNPNRPSAISSLRCVRKFE